MSRKLFTFLLLAFIGVKAKAQYVDYEPNPLPPSSSTPQRSLTSTRQEQTETVAAYSINATTGAIRKYKLKVAAKQKTFFIASYKELVDEYWTDFHPVNRPVIEKISRYDKLSEQFEYKVYMPTLSTTLYF